MWMEGILICGCEAKGHGHDDVRWCMNRLPMVDYPPKQCDGCKEAVVPDKVDPRALMDRLQKIFERDKWGTVDLTDDFRTDGEYYVDLLGAFTEAMTELGLL